MGDTLMQRDHVRRGAFEVSILLAPSRLPQELKLFSRHGAL